MERIPFVLFFIFPPPVVLDLLRTIETSFFPPFVVLDYKAPLVPSYLRANLKELRRDLVNVEFHKSACLALEIKTLGVFRSIWAGHVDSHLF